MFNLESQIAAWRKELSRAGLHHPEGLSELENHLREDIEQQMRGGLSAQQAFEAAVARIGQAHALRREFAKLGPVRKVRVWRVMAVACSTFAGFFSLMIAPKLFGHHEASVAERMLGLAGVLLTILSIPGWRYGYMFLPVISNPRVRLALGATCCFAGVVWMWLFITAILPQLLQLPADDSGFSVGLVLAAIAWAFTLLAMFGGIAYGLEEAARRRPLSTNS